ncbi:MAG: 50S ribosomal protein L2 [Candidatus Micrarchaeaceae archaeon]
MGKMIRLQRRGKGSHSFTTPPNTFKADVAFGKQVGEGKVTGEVIEFIDDPGHSAPLMRVKYDDQSENVLLAPEGIKLGDRIEEGSSASVSLGSILPLKSIPDGMLVYNVEMAPGDGGKVARASGSYATVLAHVGDRVNLMLPSKKTLYIQAECRAEIGAVAGGGKEAQPILKAGKHHYMMHAVNGYWPGHRGVKSNPVDHPFGGKQHHKGFSSMVSRNAPPGAKVGHIAARRIGRRKRG